MDLPKTFTKKHTELYDVDILMDKNIVASIQLSAESEEEAEMLAAKQIKVRTKKTIKQLSI
jgi:hypothetical protein